MSDDDVVFREREDDQQAADTGRQQQQQQQQPQQQGQGQGQGQKRSLEESVNDSIKRGKTEAGIDTKSGFNSLTTRKTTFIRKDNVQKVAKVANVPVAEAEQLTDEELDKLVKEAEGFEEMGIDKDNDFVRQRLEEFKEKVKSSIQTSLSVFGQGLRAAWQFAETSAKLYQNYQAEQALQKGKSAIESLEKQTKELEAKNKQLQATNQTQFNEKLKLLDQILANKHEITRIETEMKTEVTRLQNQIQTEKAQTEEERVQRKKLDADLAKLQQLHTQTLGELKEAERRNLINNQQRTAEVEREVAQKTQALKEKESQLRAALSKIQEDLLSSNNKVEALKTEVQRLGVDLRDAEQRNAQSQRALDETTTELNHRTRELEELRQKHANVQGNNEALQFAMIAKEAQVQQLNGLITQMRTEGQQLLQEHEALKQQLASKDAERLQLINQYTYNYNELQNAHRAIQRENVTLKATGARLERQVNEQKQEIDQQRETNKTLGAELKQSKAAEKQAQKDLLRHKKEEAERAAQNQKAFDLQATRIDSLKSERDKLRKEVEAGKAESKAALDAVNKQLEEVETRASKAEAEIRQQTEKLQEAKDRVAELERKGADLLRSNTLNEERVKAYQQDLEHAKHAVHEREAELAALNARHESTINKMVAHHQKELETQRAERINLEKTIAHQKEELETLNKKVASSTSAQARAKNETEAEWKSKMEQEASKNLVAQRELEDKLAKTQQEYAELQEKLRTNEALLAVRDTVRSNDQAIGASLQQQPQLQPLIDASANMMNAAAAALQQVVKQGQVATTRATNLQEREMSFGAPAGGEGAKRPISDVLLELRNNHPAYQPNQPPPNLIDINNNNNNNQDQEEEDFTPSSPPPEYQEDEEDFTPSSPPPEYQEDEVPPTSASIHDERDNIAAAAAYLQQKRLSDRLDALRRNNRPRTPPPPPPPQRRVNQQPSVPISSSSSSPYQHPYQSAGLKRKRNPYHQVLDSILKKQRIQF